LNKLYSLPQLAPIIQDLKKIGKQIILANGCFDLIHVGHIRYLVESKELGDILVLALNSDASVAKLKGKGRPILDEKERVEILSSLSCVDYITIFQENDVNNILLLLKPHIHAKGSDYTTDSVPEKETVKHYGGRVAITGGPKVRSTSDIIEAIKSKFG
jgi:rfaE bifunctional protein nucleotidyltransferase chain/domain